MSKEWNNCKAVVAQIKRGEWTPRFNEITNHCCTAKRGDKEIWISLGPFFVDSYPETNAFGILGRHYVYWAAVRKMKKEGDRKGRQSKQMDKPDYTS